MVVANRVSWIRNCIESGQHVRLHVGAARDNDKCKVRITVDPRRGNIGETTRNLLLASFNALELDSQQVIVMDRGHRHSTGKSEVCFWIASRELSNMDSSEYDDRGDNGDDDDGDDDENSSDKSKRAPESSQEDPWQNGNDPWSKARNNEHKHPQQRDDESTLKKPRTMRGESERTERFAAAFDNKISLLESKIDLLLAGMSMAIGPGFADLMRDVSSDGMPDPQPDTEPSPAPTKANSALAGNLPAHCLVFDMARDDELSVCSKTQLTSGEQAQTQIGACCISEYQKEIDERCLSHSESGINIEHFVESCNMEVQSCDVISEGFKIRETSRNDDTLAPSLKESSCQTRPSHFPKYRRSRVNGRAVQVCDRNLLCAAAGTMQTLYPHIRFAALQWRWRFFARSMYYKRRMLSYVHIKLIQMRPALCLNPDREAELHREAVVEIEQMSKKQFWGVLLKPRFLM